MDDLSPYILKYLEENHIEYKEKERYFLIQCVNPLHDDRNPSMIIYKNSGTGICSSCNHRIYIKGDNKSNTEYYKKRLKFDVVKKRTIFREVSIELPPEYIIIDQGFPDYQVTPEMAKELKIGFCANGYLSRPKKEVCDKCSLNDFYYSDSGSCFFARQRMMTPIFHNGELFSIESRDLTRKSKKKILYPKGSQAHNTIFNYENLKFDEILYVVEGIKSCMSLYKNISKNSTAIFSNRLKGQQRNLIRNFKKIVLIPDHGVAGDVTVDEFRGLDIPELWILRLPKMLVCKKCKSKFRQTNLKECLSCGSEDLGFADLFDMDVNTVKSLVYNKILKVESTSVNRKNLDNLILDR